MSAPAGLGKGFVCSKQGTIRSKWNIPIPTIQFYSNASHQKKATSRNFFYFVKRLNCTKKLNHFFREYKFSWKVLITNYLSKVIFSNSLVENFKPWFIFWGKVEYCLRVYKFTILLRKCLRKNWSFFKDKIGLSVLTFISDYVIRGHSSNTWHSKGRGGGQPKCHVSFIFCLFFN